MERADLIEQVLVLHAIRWEHREGELRRNYIEAKQRGNTHEIVRLACELLPHLALAKRYHVGLGARRRAVQNPVDALSDFTEVCTES